MDSRIIGDRVELRRSEDERRPIAQRLSRIEGQVRGLRTMIEEDRYCLDEVQQVNAITAALREVALIIIRQHVSEGLAVAVRSEEKALAVDDIMRVLKAAMRSQG
jgi:CsoR family transcriptional regulator, copper-sensing transcriptional repressor